MNSKSINAIPPTDSLHPETLRYHYLDNLRALALMLGVLFHAALAYVPYLQDVWLVADTSTNKSLTLEALAWFSHLFRMPLFMLIAGFFAHYLLNKRGLAGFIKNRSVRVLAPFVIFLPLVLGAFIGVVIYAAKTVENKPPLLELIVSQFGKPDAQPMHLSTMHLWFLFNLLLFYIVAIFLIKVRVFSIEKWLSGCSVQRLRWVLLLGLPLIIVPSFYSQPLPPLQAPDRIYPQLWSFGYYGIFFGVGWLFFNNKYLLDGLKNYWKPMLIFSLLMYAVVFSLYPRSITLEAAMELATNPGAYTAEPIKHLLLSIMQAFIAVYMVFTLLIIGQKVLNKQNKILRYAADSSYWIYIIHMPIMIFTQAFLMNKEWNLWLEFSLTCLITFAMGLLSYQLLVRHTPLGWMLNGRRKSKP